MTTYTNRKPVTVKTAKSESEKAASRERNATRRDGVKALERKPFNLLG